MVGGWVINTGVCIIDDLGENRLEKTGDTIKMKGIKSWIFDFYS